MNVYCCIRPVIAVFAYAVLCSGCQGRTTIPQFKPVKGMSATVYAVPDLGISAIAKVEVPQDQLPLLVTLLEPREVYPFKISQIASYHVADIVVEHVDGTSANVMVRWTGDNPAAVSLDNGASFFNGGSDGFSNGALRIVHLLNKYDYQNREAGG